MERTRAIGVEQMTDKKPKFNTTVCFHCGVDKAVEIAKAFEQGKLATIKQIAEILNNTDQVKFVYIRDMESWLKSQLSRGVKGVIPLKPLGVSVKSGKRQSAGSPRNPESLKKCKECGLACGGGKKKEGSE